MNEFDLVKSILPGIGDQFLKPQVKTQIPYVIGFNPKPLDLINGGIIQNNNFINADTLRKITTHTSLIRCETLVNLFNQILPLYGLNNPEVFHEWIAEIAHESCEFSTKEENLRYSKEGLLKIFPKHFNADTAVKYAMQPVKIANKVYANRNGNGNEASGDGWKFRGGGFIQLTGRAIYTAYGLYIGKTAEEAANLVRTDDYFAIDCACWYFCIYKSLMDEAKRDEFKKITKIINGALLGFEDREKYYERAKQYIF